MWGRLKSRPSPGCPSTFVPLAPDTGDEAGLSKQVIRQRVWEFMERNDIANFPRPVYNRIPNFKVGVFGFDGVCFL